LLGSNYYIIRILNSLIINKNINPKIKSKIKVTKVSKAFTINFKSSIPFTEILSCIKKGIKLIYNLYIIN
ncbi:hypothetical protein IWW34DRAFT_620610, partial [Fusarium oxysporum f. sp. albedinis]